ncbi:MAG: hypothetical protein EXQ94_13270 [Alphaproteobacteria bacterium]|nr:hypothetical protein [Alphaproteobacteria bacterium]
MLRRLFDRTTAVMTCFVALIAVLVAPWTGFREAIAGSTVVLILCLVARLSVRSNYDLGEAAAAAVERKFGRAIRNTSPLPSFVIDQFRSEDGSVEPNSGTVVATPDSVPVQRRQKPSRPRPPTVRHR